jgi:hypothetical protein
MQVMAVAVASACSHAPAPATVDSLPALRLAPVTLGRTLMLQQRVTVFTPGRDPVTLDVLLEADAERVRLAVIALGVTVARLEWNGSELTSEHVQGWPTALKSERVLQDLQLALWPASAVRAALPDGWSLIDEPGRRTLRHLDEDVTVVSYPDARHIELDHRRGAYRLSIESQAVSQ